MELAMTSLDAFRPVEMRLPSPEVAESQRRTFFAQMHRWMRRDLSVQVFCNNPGEAQRFQEVWEECNPAGNRPVEPAVSTAAEAAAKPTPPGKQPTGKGVPKASARTREAGTGSPDAHPALQFGSLGQGFVAEEFGLVVVTDAEVFGRYKVQRPRRMKSPHAAATRSVFDISFTDFDPGDYVVHLQQGIGRFVGLESLPAPGGTKHGDGPVPEQECLVIEYARRDPEQPPPKLYVPVTEAHLVSKYVGAGRAKPPLSTLGGNRWNKTKAQAAAAVRDLAADLLSLQAARDSQPGQALPPDTPWQREFESAFVYEETPDQVTAIEATRQDLEAARPMDRLICGDVGFGKTEVAIRAAFKAVMGGRQVAVLVPTTVLAQQHYNTFRERMADYPVRVELLSRFRSKHQQDQVIASLAGGGTDIVVGTHRLLSSDIAFKDLGLVVIDEEQRFGVAHKERLKQIRQQVDVLTLSATPIPRTLYLALTGARDMSTIETPPQDRLPVETIVAPFDEGIIREAIEREINRGGQVFFLHNRILDIEAVALKLKALLPNARIGIGHGQMKADDLEEVMTRFINGETDVLLSTTIIESGIDIPNANTIIIDRADRFGLSDLYQLRGRVGRYKHQAFAYLLIPRHAGLLADARKRISAIRQFSAPGSGFKIAMRDLEIRGAGNLLGKEQSGHITAVGFELYCQLLKESVHLLKGEPLKRAPKVSLRLDFLDIGGLAGSQGMERPGKATGNGGSQRLRRRRTLSEASGIGPDVACFHPAYVPEPQQRIELYRRLAQIADSEALKALQAELRDRFGPIPGGVDLLLQLADLRLQAAAKQIEAIEVREDKLMLTRRGDYLMVGGRFPRLSKPTAEGRLKEIVRVIRAL
jgi:transcription-repair coupling factor (superfamily II helicase)